MTRPHRGEGRPLGRRSLLDRIVRLHRADAARVEENPAADTEVSAPSLESLTERLDHLEAVVEDLQDALHRRSVQQDAKLDDLRRTTKPAEIARALAEDARARGL